MCLLQKEVADECSYSVKLQIDGVTKLRKLQMNAVVKFLLQMNGATKLQTNAVVG